ncbi:probable transcriptional regulatory protein THEYE_A1868 [Panonychus citri]|uniref:probable transcriptional regulatory protein THEYE_A1868 n=1 Tax=Panonychus citri TaxID=50023 RepID=UPI0023073F49|nr:probable transcriptional regulatory protein THEYE_A1868 [Panonychus citri]
MFGLVFNCRLLPRVINVSSLRFAGHNKWSNIKHTKTAKDVAKGQLINRHLWAIKHAITCSGGVVDPKLNDKLADALADARKAEVPAATIERTLKKATEKKTKPFIFEIVGPGGSFILVEGESDNIGTSRTALKGLLRPFKGHYNWAREGALLKLFTQKGVVRINRIDKDGNPIDFDKAEEVGIEAGAEEVRSIEDDEESKSKETSETSWDLLMSKEDLFSVKGYIEKNRPDVVIGDFRLEYFPHLYVEISDQDIEKLSELVDAIDELPEVTKVFVNIK